MTKKLSAVLLLAAATLTVSTTLYAEQKSAKPVHGEYKDWPVLGVSHRQEKNSVRAIVGNDVAIKAARSGKITPWPDGTVIAKLKWQAKSHPNWPQAIVPGEFTGAEAMIKDSKKYPETGGWGFAHWEGEKLVMNDKEASAACFACHVPMKDADYVYTEPALQ